MSFENFVDNIVSKLNIKVVESLSSYVNNKCSSSTTSTQSKSLVIKDVTSHFIDGYQYDPNIQCDPDKFGRDDICNKYGLFCDDITRKCIPLCNIASKQDQNVNVNEKCIGEQISFINTSSTKDINISQKVPISFNDNISDSNNILQTSISKSLLDILGEKVNPSLLQKITNVLIENVSSSYISQTCSSNILSVQNQYVVIQGDIYCTPDSIININQQSNISNYVNCIFSTIKPKLLASSDMLDAYKNSLNSDCICDKKITSACDKNTNKRTVSYSIIKPANGNGKCNCPVNTTDETCKYTFNKSYCAPSIWSKWSECTNGYQTRNRDINIGLSDCADTYQQRICGLSFSLVKLSIQQLLVKYKFVIIGVIGLIIILLIWILL